MDAKESSSKVHNKPRWRKQLLSPPKELALRSSLSHGILPVSMSTSSLPGLVNYAFGSQSIQTRKDDWHSESSAQNTSKQTDQIERRQRYSLKMDELVAYR